MSTFTKLVVEGSSDAMRAFLAGWSAGRDMKRDDLRRRVLWPDDWGIKIDSTIKEILDTILPRGGFTVLLADEVVATIASALEPWEERLGLRVRSRHPVRGARFEFKFEIFARDQARDARKIFESVPEGVEVADYEIEEHTDPKAKGSEMYAPAHEYVCRARGAVEGALRGVLEVHERARRHERIKTTDVELQLES